MSGQYPQWNTRPYGAQSPVSGHQPVPNPGPPGPGINTVPPPNYVNGPGNPVPRNPEIPRHPQIGHAPLAGGPPPTGFAPPSGQNINRSTPTYLPPQSQNLGHNAAAVPGGQSIVNGYKGAVNQPIPGTTGNVLTSASQPMLNGPPRPNLPVVGPKGQVSGKAVSSPPGTGPIETTPLSNYTDFTPRQNTTGGIPGSMSSPGFPGHPGPRVRNPAPMPDYMPGAPPSSVASAPLIRGPPPIIQRPPGPATSSHLSGPAPPVSNYPGMRAPSGGLPGPPPLDFQPGPPVGPPIGGPPMSQELAHTPGSDRPNGLPVPYHGQAQYSSQVHLGPDPNTSGLTPGSEPASQKSSRAPSPVPSQKYDALEGQFTPGSPVQPPQGTAGQSPLGPGVSGGPTPPSLTAGKRVYPQMAPNSYMNTMGNPPVCGVGTAQPGIPSPQRVPGLATPPAPGMQPLPPTGNQGMPPAHSLAAAGLPPPGPGMPPPPMGVGAPPLPPGVSPPSSSGVPGPGPGARPNYPAPAAPVGNSVPHTPAGMANVTNNFNQMNLQPDATRPLNLLQEKNLIAPEGIESTKPNLPSEFAKVNANTNVFRCTLNAIPNTQSLLNKCRLPLGLLIHPFKDLSEEVTEQLPVIQSSVIVRCRSCRTYINPFVSFMDMRRWKCNLCFRVNELPEEFSYDPVSKSYGDPQRRPEIRSSTIEFIAPSEYMLRPPQPAVYLFLLDVSFNAVNTGYLQVFCQTLLDELDRIPGDSRTQIGFMTFDSCLQFYNLQEGLSQPQMLVVSDIEDVFLPLPEGLLVNIHESRELVNDLLNSLPSMFEGNMETGSALGPALQTAHKLLSPTGGRVSVFQTQLPTVGPGALKNREDPNERTGKKVQHLGPAIDFYKKLALDCSAQQIAVDLFLLNGQYVDLATMAGVSKYSGGCLYYFPNFHTKSNPGLTERFEGTLRRYITRKIGFESVMRIRCSRGLTIHTFHGNFFVRSTDLLSLPNINPDSGFGMQMSIEDNIESNFSCFQAALLYTSSKGERRIRVHTLCIPVTNSITEVFGSADQQAIVGLIAKMAVDKSTSQSMGDARDALVNSCVDMLGAFGATLASSQRMGQLPCPHTLRLMPAFVLALLKYTGFRTGIPTKLDDRVFGLECAKGLPLAQFLLEVYPSLYPVHMLDDQQAINKGDTVIPQPPVLQLSSGNMDRHGVYLMDANSAMYLWIGGAISDKFCQEVFNVPNFQAIQEGLTELPELDNLTSERLRAFVNYLNDQRPFPAAFQVIRDDSRLRGNFLQHMVEDRSDSAFSYYEFLQHLQKEVK